MPLERVFVRPEDQARPEIRTGRDQHVLQRVRKRLPSLLDAASDDVQSALQEDDIGRLSRDIDRIVDR